MRDGQPLSGPQEWALPTAVQHVVDRSYWTGSVVDFARRNLRPERDVSARGGSLSPGKSIIGIFICATGRGAPF